MRCTRCGCENNTGAHFCLSCGARLPEGPARPSDVYAVDHGEGVTVPLGPQEADEATRILPDGIYPYGQAAGSPGIPQAARDNGSSAYVRVPYGNAGYVFPTYPQPDPLPNRIPDPDAGTAAPKRKNAGLIASLSAVSVLLAVLIVFIALGAVGTGPFAAVFGKDVVSAEPDQTDARITKFSPDGRPDETKTAPPVTGETTPPGTDEPVLRWFDSKQIYVFRKNDFSPWYYPCVEFYPDGTFTFTENLLSGMGKMYGTYEIDGDRITLSVSGSYRSSYAGSDLTSIGFLKNGDDLIILTSVCSTESGSVFILDNGYIPSEQFFEENVDFPIPDGAVICNPARIMYVDVGYFENGHPVYLYLRTSPFIQEDNIIYGLPHGTAVTVYATNPEGTWAWIHYAGDGHTANGKDTVIDTFAWCAMWLLSDNPVG